MLFKTIYYIRAFFQLLYILLFGWKKLRKKNSNSFMCLLVIEMCDPEKLKKKIYTKFNIFVFSKKHFEYVIMYDSQKKVYRFWNLYLYSDYKVFIVM
jgi:hypothetical protein